ncbi:MAG: phage integrase N-terminal SAM-like domain-containing protein [Flavobacteriales bacterium]|nr:phage integrase N-terminal SAM-like domain-containing protein [Flavobacteriales bacterium]
MKHIKLSEAVGNIKKEVPPTVEIYVDAMIDNMLAMNLSQHTIRTYASSFLLFLRENEYKNPDEMEQKDIVKHLGGIMLRGLSASSGHSLVNALLFYYRNVLHKEEFELKIPRPKKEKKLPVVLTMPECLSLFRALDNPKHKLLLLIAYGTGLRLSELVELKWEDILLA